MRRHALGIVGLVLIVAGAVLVVMSIVSGPTSPVVEPFLPGMMDGYGSASGPGPGEPGFVAGTPSSPRVVRVLAGPGYAFSPSAITIARGETITFVVTGMGLLTHEFMVGPADAVAADRPGTPEVADIGMMETKTLTYTFDGPGPYAFACHEAGHYEAGMRGTINFVG